MVRPIYADIGDIDLYTCDIIASDITGPAVLSCALHISLSLISDLGGPAA